jgi:hypothetical protein
LEEWLTITSPAASGKKILTPDPGKNSKRSQGEDLRVVEMMAVTTEMMEGKMSRLEKAGCPAFSRRLISALTVAVCSFIRAIHIIFSFQATG